MTELSDYRRMVEGPMVKRYEERIANLITEIERLRALASPQPSEDEVERAAQAICDERFIGDAGDGWDDASDGLKEDYRKQARRAIAAMSPRPQAGMISADRACEIVGALIGFGGPIPSQYSKDVREAINTIRMEAAPLPEPPKE